MKASYIGFLFIFFSFQIAAQSASEGKQLFQQEKYAEATQMLETVVKKNPKDSVTLFYLGRSLLALNKYDEAIEQLKILTRLYPNHADFNYWCGVAYRHKLTATENFLEKNVLASKTKQYYEKAVELDTKHKDAKIALANYYINAPAIAGGSKTKALKLADELQSLDAKSAHELRANIYVSDKKYDLAASEYDQLVKFASEKDKPILYYNKGFMLQTAEQFDQAFVAFEEAIQSDRTLYRAYYQSARTAIFSKKNVTQGIEYLQFYLQNGKQLSKTDPDLSSAYWRLGMLYEIKGDKTTAKIQYEKALELNPNNENARKALEALK